MQRLLNTVSKTLGVFGVLMLMWTDGAVADADRGHRPAGLGVHPLPPPQQR